MMEFISQFTLKKAKNACPEINSGAYQWKDSETSSE